MTDQNLFSKGFPTNRIPVSLPSTGQSLVLRETTVVELKSICKTIIDNVNRRQMDVIYDAVSQYLQSMILTDGVDVNGFTEFDRLYCLMVFFQMSFFKESINYKCPHCGVDIVYRYDMSKYLKNMEQDAFVENQVVEIQHKYKTYEFTIGWPKVRDMSKLMHYFYSELGEITQEVEQTQYGINFVLAFIRQIRVRDSIDQRDEAFVDLDGIDTFRERMDCINALPSTLVFDQEFGVFSKIMGYFINRLENCFFSEICPQCHKDTYYGISQSSLFHSMFFGSLKSVYGFILQVECLMVFKYDCCIFNDERFMTYNDLTSLMKQIGVTVEKDNEQRQKSHRDNFTKGLWYIREILNTMVFPQDRIKQK